MKDKQRLYIYSYNGAEVAVRAESLLTALVKLRKVVGRKHVKYTLIGKV